MELEVPTAFAYGEVDDILPSHQGIQLSILSEGRILVYILADAWHMPFQKNAGMDVVTFIQHADDTLINTPLKKKSIKVSELPTSMISRFTSHFSLSFTQQKIFQLYRYLLEINRISSSTICSVSAFHVNGAEVTGISPDKLSKVLREIL